MQLTTILFDIVNDADDTRYSKRRWWEAEKELLYFNNLQDKLENSNSAGYQVWFPTHRPLPSPRLPLAGYFAPSVYMV